MDTIYAALSPLIPSAVIVVRISGSDACQVFDRLGIKDLEPRKVYNSNYSGSVRDDVLVTYFKGPASYTGEDVVEISFHGNPLIISSVFQDLERLNFRGAEPGEFTKRAFLNGKMDLTQAESVAELIDSKTKKGIDYSFDQLRGSMKQEINSLRSLFINILTIVEAHIDFPEEDIAEAHHEIVFKNLNRLQIEVSQIISSYVSHKILRDGFRISIVGKPNTGKSSLMNYLLKEDRALVSEVAGTTRDYIESSFVLGGVPISLVDTAGMRFTDNAIEKAGIDKTLELIEDADLVIVLLDSSRVLDAEDENVLSITNDLSRIVVSNKCDTQNVLTDIDVDCNISVKQGTNMDLFIKLCENFIAQSDAEMFSKSVMVTERQKSFFDQILESINRLCEYTEIDFDVFEFELNSSLRLLSEITGMSYTEDILSNIFDSFCIGK
ncbi:MAG: tRNA uridine-5-carboxymethylaminomethyl(34) synthesis GTPase MnmE [Denitrovibrio sp.]|nr:MAG: tRNA uridine-5-carboxymethylaminomethyl(34) synthesis GTPase MnmE [Denitrovibrio sp.]